MKLRKILAMVLVLAMILSTTVLAAPEIIYLEDDNGNLIAFNVDDMLLSAGLRGLFKTMMQNSLLNSKDILIKDVDDEGNSTTFKFESDDTPYDDRVAGADDLGDASPDYTVTAVAPDGTLTLVDENGDEFTQAPGGQPVPVDPDAVNMTALEGKITEAETLRDTYEISTDGTGVYVGDYWVTQDAVDTLQGAIDDAQALVDTPPATQTEVTNAVTALQTAMDIFDASKTEGTEEPQSGDEIAITSVIPTADNTLKVTLAKAALGLNKSNFAVKTGAVETALADVVLNSAVSNADGTQYTLKIASGLSTNGYYYSVAGIDSLSTTPVTGRYVKQVAGTIDPVNNWIMTKEDSSNTALGDDTNSITIQITVGTVRTDRALRVSDIGAIGGSSVPNFAVDGVIKGEGNSIIVTFGGTLGSNNGTDNNTVTIVVKGSAIEEVTSAGASVADSSAIGPFNYYTYKPTPGAPDISKLTVTGGGIAGSSGAFVNNAQIIVVREGDSVTPDADSYSVAASGAGATSATISLVNGRYDVYQRVGGKLSTATTVTVSGYTSPKSISSVSSGLVLNDGGITINSSETYANRPTGGAEIVILDNTTKAVVAETTAKLDGTVAKVAMPRNGDYDIHERFNGDLGMGLTSQTVSNVPAVAPTTLNTLAVQKISTDISAQPTMPAGTALRYLLVDSNDISSITPGFKFDAVVLGVLFSSWANNGSAANAAVNNGKYLVAIEYDSVSNYIVAKGVSTMIAVEPVIASTLTLTVSGTDYTATNASTRAKETKFALVDEGITAADIANGMTLATAKTALGDNFLSDDWLDSGAGLHIYDNNDCKVLAVTTDGAGFILQKALGSAIDLEEPLPDGTYSVVVSKGDATASKVSHVHDGTSITAGGKVYDVSGNTTLSNLLAADESALNPGDSISIKNGLLESVTFANTTAAKAFDLVAADCLPTIEVTGNASQILTIGGDSSEQVLTVLVKGGNVTIGTNLTNATIKSESDNAANSHFILPANNKVELNNVGDTATSTTSSAMYVNGVKFQQGTAAITVTKTATGFSAPSTSSYAVTIDASSAGVTSDVNFEFTSVPGAVPVLTGHSVHTLSIILQDTSCTQDITVSGGKVDLSQMGATSGAIILQDAASTITLADLDPRTVTVSISGCIINAGTTSGAITNGGAITGTIVNDVVMTTANTKVTFIAKNKISLDGSVNEAKIKILDTSTVETVKVSGLALASSTTTGEVTTQKDITFDVADAANTNKFVIITEREAKVTFLLNKGSSASATGTGGTFGSALPTNANPTITSNSVTITFTMTTGTAKASGHATGDSTAFITGAAGAKITVTAAT